jgi:CubicO group peptidase (beta-lactamase class C family)
VADSDALRMRRSRAHQAGIHELCLPGRCKAAGSTLEQQQAAAAVAALAAAVREEFGDADKLSLALALRLVGLAEGKGVAAVQALRALGEMVAAQRGDP